jgi:hypothetical protein
MKHSSILNKLTIKANNKQTGIVFLEYIIMAFIATVAVICAIWWFFWHLQQLTWEIKDRLNNLPRSCKLEPPYGVAPGDQPIPSWTRPVTTTGEIYAYENDPYEYLIISYEDQTIKVTNLGGGGGTGYMFYQLVTSDGQIIDGQLGPGETFTHVVTQNVEAGPPFAVQIEVWPNSGLGGDWPVHYVMNITETTP